MTMPEPAGRAGGDADPWIREAIGAIRGDIGTMRTDVGRELRDLKAAVGRLADQEQRLAKLETWRDREAEPALVQYRSLRDGGHLPWLGPAAAAAEEQADRAEEHRANREQVQHLYYLLGVIVAVAVVISSVFSILAVTHVIH